MDKELRFLERQLKISKNDPITILRYAIAADRANDLKRVKRAAQLLKSFFEKNYRESINEYGGPILEKREAIEDLFQIYNEVLNLAYGSQGPFFCGEGCYQGYREDLAHGLIYGGMRSGHFCQYCNYPGAYYKPRKRKPNML